MQFIIVDSVNRGNKVLNDNVCFLIIVTPPPHRRVNQRENATIVIQVQEMLNCDQFQLLVTRLTRFNHIAIISFTEGHLKVRSQMRKITVNNIMSRTI